MNMAAKPVSHMMAEIQEAPDVVARQETTLAGPLRDLARRLKERPPQVVVTVARGSSAHAAAFAKHAIERHLGIPVAAAFRRHASSVNAVTAIRSARATGMPATEFGYRRASR